MDYNKRIFKILFGLAVFVFLPFFCNAATPEIVANFQGKNFDVEMRSKDPSISGGQIYAVASEFLNLMEAYKMELETKWFNECMGNIKPKAVFSITLLPDNTERGNRVTVTGSDFINNQFHFSLEGSRRVLLGTAIKHNVTYIVLYYYLKIPRDNLPLWVTEGIGYLATTNKNLIEERKTMLFKDIEKPYYGFRMAELFTFMGKYPDNPVKKKIFTSQAASVVEYLTQSQCDGKRLFIKFVKKAIEYNYDWEKSLKEVYFAENKSVSLWSSLKEMQDNWLDWLAISSPQLQAPKPGIAKSLQMKKVNPTCDIGVIAPYPPISDPNPSRAPDYPSFDTSYSPLKICNIKVKVFYSSWLEESIPSPQIQPEAKRAVEEIDRELTQKNNYFIENPQLAKRYYTIIAEQYYDISKPSKDLLKALADLAYPPWKAGDKLPLISISHVCYLTPQTELGPYYDRMYGFQTSDKIYGKLKEIIEGIYKI